MTEPESDVSQSLDRNRQPRMIGGRQILFDGEGFLWYLEEWSEEVAQVLAVESGLQLLTEQHWNIMRYMRGHYLENGRAPLNRQLSKSTGLSLLQIEALFPGGIKYGARRLAGLPNPKTCM